MTYKEADYFYSQDKKKYILKDNKKFLKWYKDNIIHQLFSISELQYLIDFLFNWFKIKYPNENTELGVDDISKYLTKKQMFFRLNPKYYSFLNNTYRTGKWLAIQSLYCLSEDGEIIENKKNDGMIAISISNTKVNQQKEGTIFCSLDGVVNKEQIFAFEPVYFDQYKTVKTDEKFEPFLLSLFKDDNYLTLDEFYKRGIEKTTIYDFKQVKQTLDRKKNDQKLRELIFAWTIEKIIFDENSTPEDNITRARFVVKELKQDYLNTNINEQIVDEYYNMLLENVEKEKKLRK